MTIKFRYVFGTPGKPELYFFRYFTIEEIEDCKAYLEEWHNGDFSISLISRDRFIGKHDKNGVDIFENDIDSENFVVTWRYGICAFELIEKETGRMRVITDSILMNVEIVGNVHGVKI